MIDDDSTAVFLADYRERAAAVNTLKTADEKREARRALTTHRRRKVEAVAGKWAPRKTSASPALGKITTS